jgi:MFS family permease
VDRNVAALIGDFLLFSIGLAFYDPIVVVPAFVETFTGSEFLVGVLAAVRVLMMTLPQVWAASVLVARPTKKPLLVWSSIGGRVPILFLAGSTLLWAGEAPWAVVGVLGWSVAFFFVSEGLNSISWPALVGKVVPEGVRGRFFGAGQLLSSLGALGAGAVVRLLLAGDGAADPARWAALFGCSFVGMMLSVASMSFVREEPADQAASRVSVGRSMRAMAGFLREERWLRQVVAAQILLGTAAATAPFFVIRAQEIVPGGAGRIGLYLIVQQVGGVAAALICGQLIDRVGSWASIRLVAGVQVGALLAATGAAWVAPGALYVAAFTLLGFVGASSWWSFSAYLLDQASEAERPIYLATTGILTSPTFLASLAMGALFERVVPEWVLGGAVALSAAGLALAWSIPKGAGVMGSVQRRGEG